MLTDFLEPLAKFLIDELAYALDGWTSLAQARADPHIWLPALVAALG